MGTIKVSDLHMDRFLYEATLDRPVMLETPTRQFRHTPGGHDHDQSEHGNREGGSAAQGPTSPLPREFTKADSDRRAEELKTALYDGIDTDPQSNNIAKKIETQADLVARIEWQPEQLDALFQTFGARVDSASYNDPDRVISPEEKESLTVRGMVSQWASTSGDSNEQSIAMQIAAEREFGLQGAIHPWDTHYDTSPGASRHRDGPLVEQATAVLDGSTNAGLNSLLGPGDGGARQHFLREMYENTQADLRAKGITELVVYRGMDHEFPPAGHERIGTADYQRVDGEALLQPMSAFSLDRKTASDFAGGEAQRYQRVQAAVIPAERVIGYPGTGYGNLRETEVVVLGGPVHVSEVAWNGYDTYFEQGPEAMLFEPPKEPVASRAPKPKPIQLTSPDGELRNADWTKTSWDVDLPEPGTPEFLGYITGLGFTLEEFQQLPVWRHRHGSSASEMRHPGGPDHDQSDHGNWASGLTTGTNAPTSALPGPEEFGHFQANEMEQKLSRALMGSVEVAVRPSGINRIDPYGDVDQVDDEGNPIVSTDIVATDFDSEEHAIAKKIEVQNELSAKVGWSDEQANEMFRIFTWPGAGIDELSNEDKTREAVRQLVDQWAATSGDNNVEAVAMQLAAEREFGLRGALHPWDTHEGSVGPFDEGQLIITTDYWSQELVTGTLEQPYSDPGNRSIDGALVSSANERLEIDHGARQQFLRTMYDNTQAELRAEGITELTVYRGMDHDYMPAGHTLGDEDEVAIGPRVDGVTVLQPMSSFSTNREVATRFVDGDDQRYGRMQAMVIPAERVLSYPGSGYGALEEREVVVLGGPVTVSEVAMGPRRRFAEFIDLEDSLFQEPVGATPAVQAPGQMELELSRAPKKEKPFEFTSPDMDLKNADWTKQTWDITREGVELMVFVEAMGYTWEEFTELPVWKHRQIVNIDNARAVRHGDHDQSTHGNRGGGSSEPITSAGRDIKATDLRPKPAFIEDVEGSSHRRLGELATNMGYFDPNDPNKNDMAAAHEALKRDLTDNLREELKTAVIQIRIDDDVFGLMVDEGDRFRSQMETGTSGGYFDDARRIDTEARMFGYSNALDPAERPIYGYIAPAGQAGENQPILNQYGDVIVELKDELRERTTVTWGDSLYHHDVNTGAPSPMLDPKWYSAVGEGGILDQAVDLKQNALDQNLDRAQPYMEAQIHGSVTLDDIKRVTLPPLSEATGWGGWGMESTAREQRAYETALLEERGIEVIERDTMAHYPEYYENSAP